MGTPHDAHAIAIAIVLMAASGPLHAADLTVRKESRIDIVYITAADCVNCKSWRYMRNGDWARFSDTSAAQQVNLITIDKTTLRNRIERSHYPAEYAHLFDVAPQFGNTVPAWWIVLDGKPVARRVGESNWKKGIEPVLEKLAAARQNGGGLVVHETARPPKPTTVPESVVDADNVPYLSASGRESYRKFLASTLPRAFALSPDGAFSWRSGGTDAAVKAMDTCNSLAVEFPCQLYAVDNKIIFKIQ
jgi:hypothetical protein